MLSALVLLCAIGVTGDGPPDPAVAFGHAQVVRPALPPKVVPAPAVTWRNPPMPADFGEPHAATVVPRSPTVQHVQLPMAAQSRQTRLQIKLRPAQLVPITNNVPEITEPLMTIGDVYELTAQALASVPVNRQREARFISCWPLPEEQWENVENALLFWTASLSNRRTYTPPTRVGGLGWMIYLSDYDWDATAWESMVRGSPYVAVTVEDPHHPGITPYRGWINPATEFTVRNLTYSQQAVERADRFLALTGLDVGGGGYYSRFLRLPANEGELFKRFGVDERFLRDNRLIKGGAVLGGKSLVALHNRELQKLPTVVGLDQTFLWRSLDMLTDTGEQSVLDNFIGTVKSDANEYIGTNLNGTHYYYLANKQKRQIAEADIHIAWDRTDAHDPRVVTPYKCVSCHGPFGGLRHFDSAILKMMVHPKTALGVVRNFPPPLPDRTREALEDYYASDLGKDIAAGQTSYTAAIKDLNGLDPRTNAENFVGFVDRFLFENVTKQQACREFGVEPALIDEYLKQTGNTQLLALLADETLPRKAFEDAFADGMRARIHPWERSPPHVHLEEVRPSNAPPAGAPPAGVPGHVGDAYHPHSSYGRE